MADELDTGAILSATDRLMRTLRGPLGGAASWEWSDLLAAATGRSPFEFTSLAREAGLAVPDPSNVEPADIAAQLLRVARDMGPADRARVHRVARLLDPSLPDHNYLDADTQAPLDEVASGAPEVEDPSAAGPSRLPQPNLPAGPPPGPLAEPDLPVGPPPAPVLEPEQQAQPPAPFSEAVQRWTGAGPSPHPAFRADPPPAAPPGPRPTEPPPPWMQPGPPLHPGFQTGPPPAHPAAPPSAPSEVQFPHMPPVHPPRTVPDAKPKKRNVAGLIWFGVVAFFVIRGLIEGGFGGG